MKSQRCSCIFLVACIVVLIYTMAMAWNVNSPFYLSGEKDLNVIVLPSLTYHNNKKHFEQLHFQHFSPCSIFQNCTFSIVLSAAGTDTDGLSKSRWSIINPINVLCDYHTFLMTIYIDCQADCCYLKELSKIQNTHSWFANKVGVKAHLW